MEFATANLGESPTKLNTKGCCFLCLKTYDSELVNGEDDRKSVFIGHLLRHFQIGDNSVGDHTLGASSKSKEFEVDLCKACEKIIARFSVLRQQLEKIQIEMNYYVQSIHQSISESGKEFIRVQTYSKRMTSDPESLSQLAFVDKLRKELAAKSSTRQFNHSSLCVKLEKIKPQPTQLQVVKEETNVDYTNGLGNDDSFDFPLQSPPPSPESGSHSKTEKIEICTQPSSIQSTYQENNDMNPLSGIMTKSTCKIFPKKIYTKNLVTGMFICNQCDKKSLHKSTIIRHYDSVHLQKRYKCDLCNNAAFVRLSNLKMHKETCRQKTLEIRKGPKFKFVCKMCGKMFEKNKQLCDHRLKAHQHKDRFPCDLCEQKFKQSSHLKEHRDVIHFGKRFSCRFCGKIYSRRASQRRHEKSCLQKSRIKKESVEEKL